MMKALLATMLAVVGCHGAEAGDDPPREPAERPRLQNESMVRYHMQRHFDDLKTIERMLIDGRLDDAKTLAVMLTKPSRDPGLAAWEARSREVVDRASALTATRDVYDALRRVTDVSTACASCHLAVQKTPVFRPPGKPPQDLSTRAARMARHAWAVDRLWEGMVAASDDHWRAGLDVLRGEPAPPSPDPTLGELVQSLARAAHARTQVTTLEQRARSYAEILTACAGCHRVLRKPAR